MTIEPGEWAWIDSIIGLSIALILCAYVTPYWRTERTPSDGLRMVATSACASLIACLILAKPIQELFVRRFTGLSGDALAERVDNYVLPWVWLGLFLSIAG